MSTPQEQLARIERLYREFRQAPKFSKEKRHKRRAYERAVAKAKARAR